MALELDADTLSELGHGTPEPYEFAWWAERYRRPNNNGMWTGNDLAKAKRALTYNANKKKRIAMAQQAFRAGLL